ncbi:MAG: HD domain-containing protein [Deltaproteobacteria bacterium]|nr:HD domain-containing protein [Deltaproteobacteria bacterium]
MSITREAALSLLKDNLNNERMIAHCLASEAVMIALAQRLGEDEQKWGIAGLLHDIDLDLVGGDLSQHGWKAREILLANGFDEEIADAILMHNEMAAGKERSTVFQHALAAGETITGLILATTMVYPDKKLTSVKPKSVVKRMKEKLFAASVKRENILECEKIGIPLEEFAALAISAMLPISAEMGL